MNLFKLLAVILALEGNPSGKPADGGTTYGPYCISSEVLYDYNSRHKTSIKPYQLEDALTSESVALDHLAWLRKQLPKSDVRTLAAAWNAGLTGQWKGRGKEYGKRAEQLYKEAK